MSEHIRAQASSGAPHGAAVKISGLWKRAACLISREHFCQSNCGQRYCFLTTISIACWSDSSQLGIYAVAMSFLFSLLLCQDSLILQLYVLQRYYPQGTPTHGRVKNSINVIAAAY